MKSFFLLPVGRAALLVSVGLLSPISYGRSPDQSLSHYVVYGPQAFKQNGVTHAGTTAVYLDRLGDLYPEASTHLRVDNNRLLDHGGALQNYFQCREEEPALQVRQQQQADSLGRLYGVQLGAPLACNLPRPDSTDNAWLRLQDSMQTRFARHWAQQLRAAHTQRLVILVHGYNNEVGQTTWYADLERQIRTHYFRQENVQFLQLYWDGRASNVLGTLSIWGWAQGSLYPIGLSLRQLLAKLDPDLPVYILGHSTGAPLVCAALWNCTSALEDSTTYEARPGHRYLNLLALPRYATPRLRQVRVAFIAPAMPALHFDDYNDRTYATGRQPSDRHPQDYQRFVVGHNHHDKATGKLFFSTNTGGSTRLGVKKDEFCGDGSATSSYGIVPLLARRGSHASTYLFDFTPGIRWLGTGHGVAEFMGATAIFEHFLNAWLTELPVQGNDVCSPAK